MKKFILTIIAALSIGSVAMAQNENGRRPRMDRSEMIKQRTEMMVKQYGLNAEQAAALQALNEKTMNQMGGQRRDGQRPEGGDSARVRPQRRNSEASGQGNGGQRNRFGQGGQRFGGQNNEAYENELKKIMTEEQYKVYQDDRKKMMDRFGQGGQRRGGQRGGGQFRQRNNEE